jgi:hypothetical protein
MIYLEDTMNPSGTAIIKLTGLFLIPRLSVVRNLTCQVALLQKRPGDLRNGGLGQRRFQIIIRQDISPRVQFYRKREDCNHVHSPIPRIVVVLRGKGRELPR